MLNISSRQEERHANPPARNTPNPASLLGHTSSASHYPMFTLGYFHAESEAGVSMGQLHKFISRLMGSPTPAPESAPSHRDNCITVAITGPAEADVHVSDAEVAERAKDYSFVLTTDPPPLKTADQWWEEATHKRRVRDGSDKAYAYLLPFMTLEVAKHEQLQKAQERWGPHGAVAIAKELRVLIRERRSAKQPHEDLLQALYGTAILADLLASLEFEGLQPHAMTQYVDIHELQTVRCDYSTIGYQCIASLSKTEVKWLVEAFGEPAEHQSFDALWPHVRRNAISRYCWSELRRSRPQKTMQEWLNHLLKRNIGYHKAAKQ